MDSYQLQFSEMVDLANDEEVVWVRQQLARREPAGGRAWEEPADDSDRFSWKIITEPTGERCLRLYSDDWADPQAVGRFMQAFLQRFKPSESFGLTFTYCFDADSRLDETGGGAIFVTADSFDKYDIGDWLAKKYRAHLKANAAPQAKR